MQTDEEVLANKSLSRNDKFLFIHGKYSALLNKQVNAVMETPVCDKDDYLQEAILTILDSCIENFKPEFDVKFSTYMTACIKDTIKGQVNRFYGPFTISIATSVLLRKVKAMLDSGLSIDNIKFELNERDSGRIQNMLFLLKLHRIDEDFCQDVTEIPSKLIIEDAKLSTLELRILQDRQTMTLRQVAKKFSKSHEWIRNIETEALDKVYRVLRGTND